MAVALVYGIFKEDSGSISPGPILQEFDKVKTANLWGLIMQEVDKVKTANLSDALLHGSIRPTVEGAYKVQA